MDPTPATNSDQDADNIIKHIQQSVALELTEEDDWRDILTTIRDDIVAERVSVVTYLTEDEKNDLMKELTLHLTNQLKQQTVSFEELPEIASYLLGHIDRLSTKEEVGDFLYILRIRFSNFSSYSRIAAVSDLPAREQIEQLANSMNQ